MVKVLQKDSVLALILLTSFSVFVSSIETTVPSKGQNVAALVTSLEQKIANLENALKVKTDEQKNKLESVQADLRSAQAEISQLNAGVKKRVEALDKVANRTNAETLRLNSLKDAYGVMKQELGSALNQLTTCQTEQSRLSAELASQKSKTTDMSNVMSTVNQRLVTVEKGTEDAKNILAASANHSFQLSSTQEVLAVKIKNLAAKSNEQDADLDLKLSQISKTVADLANKQPNLVKPDASCRCNSSIAVLRQEVSAVKVDAKSCQQVARYGYTKSNEALSKISKLEEELTKVKTSESRGSHNAGVPNLKQFTWSDFIKKNTDVIQTFKFHKKSPETGLRLTFHGETHVLVPNRARQCCNRWYFIINGSKCTTPNSIESIVAKAGSNSIGYMLPTTVSGICYQTAMGKFSGTVTVRLAVSRCDNDSKINDVRNIPSCEAWTGTEIKTPSSVVIEEV